MNVTKIVSHLISDYNLENVLGVAWKMTYATKSFKSSNFYVELTINDYGNK